MRVKKIGRFYKLAWPFRYLMAPTKFSYVLDNSIDKSVNLLNTNNPETLSLCFLGDFMGVGNKKVFIDDELKSYINSSDKVIFNLESVVTNHKGLILGKQHTSPDVFSKFLSQFIKDKVLINVANNHLFDFGVDGVVDTLNNIQENNCNYFGTINRPKLEVAKDLFIQGSTFWFNKEDRFVNRFQKLTNNNQTIHFVHWGDEFKKFPSDEQRDFIENLDMNCLSLIGHHSHSPQPIEIHNNKVIAYSLGNFATYFSSEKINNGIILKLNLINKNSSWQLVSCEWDQIFINIERDYTLVTREKR